MQFSHFTYTLECRVSLSSIMRKLSVMLGFYFRKCVLFDPSLECPEFLVKWKVLTVFSPYLLSLSLSHVCFLCEQQKVKIGW